MVTFADPSDLGNFSQTFADDLIVLRELIQPAFTFIENYCDNLNQDHLFYSQTKYEFKATLHLSNLPKKSISQYE